MRRLMAKVFRGSVWWVGTVAVARWFADPEHGEARRTKARELISRAGRRAGEAVANRQPDLARRINSVAGRIEPSATPEPAGRPTQTDKPPVSPSL